MSPVTAIVKSTAEGQKDYYEAHAAEYFSATVGLDMSSVYELFLGKLPRSAHIVDAGCGSGRDTKAFLQRGYAVTAFDSSAEMARVASAYTGQPCGVLRFQDMEFQDQFDAAWACASLLHVPKREIADVLRRFVAALKPGGIMYASFIDGEGERIGEDGRFYNSYTAKSLRALTSKIPKINEIECWTSAESSSSLKRSPWLNSLFRKDRF
jgi:SAM-dependent methyltransferase